MKERSEEFWESATVLVRLVGAVAFLAVLIYMVADTCAYRAEAQDEAADWTPHMVSVGVVDDESGGIIYEGEPCIPDEYHTCLWTDPKTGNTYDLTGMNPSQADSITTDEGEPCEHGMICDGLGDCVCAPVPFVGTTVEWPGITVRTDLCAASIAYCAGALYELGLASDGTVRWRELEGE
jgi:hypothetical protein